MKTLEPVSLSDRLSAASSTTVSSHHHNYWDSVYLNREIQGTEDLYSHIGHTLGNHPLFRDNSLTLFCGVPFTLLLPDNPPLMDEYLDFVICQGQDIITVIKAERPELDQPAQNQLHPLFCEPSQDQLHRLFCESALPSELNWSIFDSLVFTYPNQAVSPIVSLINQALHTPGPHIKTSLRPIPAKLLQELSAPHIQALTKKEAGRTKGWYPTEYGRSLGILQGFQTDKNGRVRSLLCCAEKNLDTLRQAISWGEQTLLPQTQETQRKTSLAQRISLVDQGLPDNNTAAATLEDQVLKFAQTPLTDYLQGNPEGLSELQRIFPDAHTYQQAASCISQNGNKQHLGILANPIIYGENIPFADKPIRSVLWAASNLAKSQYLTWVGKMLLHDCDSSGKARNWSYRQWLQWVNGELAKGGENTDFFRTLFNRLVAEPFSLINLQTQYTHI